MGGPDRSSGPSGGYGHPWPLATKPLGPPMCCSRPRPIPCSCLLGWPILSQGAILRAFLSPPCPTNCVSSPKPWAEDLQGGGVAGSPSEGFPWVGPGLQRGVGTNHGCVWGGWLAPESAPRLGQGLGEGPLLSVPLRGGEGLSSWIIPWFPSCLKYVFWVVPFPSCLPLSLASTFSASFLPP